MGSVSRIGGNKRGPGFRLGRDGDGDPGPAVGLGSNRILLEVGNLFPHTAITNINDW
jgi:hypothetical protein